MFSFVMLEKKILNETWRQLYGSSRWKMLSFQPQHNTTQTIELVSKLKNVDACLKTWQPCLRTTVLHCWRHKHCAPAIVCQASSGITALPAKNMISPKQGHDLTEASELVLKIANNDAQKLTWQQSMLALILLKASPDSCTAKPDDQSYRTIAIMSIMTKWVTYQKLIVKR